MAFTRSLIPEFVFASPPQPETDGDDSPHIAESLDWLEKQQKALALAKDSIRAALDKQVINADKQRQDATFKEGEMVLIHRDFLSTEIS